MFNTSLPHEYYLLGELLTRRKVPEAEVLQWLDWLRRNGRDSSFLRYSPADPRVRRLLNWLERISLRLYQEIGETPALTSFWERFHR